MISIIVPIYNTPEPLLRQCLSKLKSNRNCEFEVLLINDGSHSYIEEICLKFSNENHNFFYFFKKNGGVSSARNFGLNNSNSEWVTFVDPDDIFNIENLLSRPKIFQSNSDIIFLGYGTIINQNTLLKTFKVSDLVNIVKYESSSDEKKKAYLINSLLRVSEDYSDTQGFYLGTPWAKLFNRNFLLKNKLEFDLYLRKRQDALFCANCYSCNPKIDFDHSNDITYFYRTDNSESITKKYNPEIKEMYKYLFKNMEDIVSGSSQIDDAALSLYAYDLIKETINLDFCNVNNKKKYKDKKRDFIDFTDSRILKKYLVKLELRNMKRWKKTLYNLIFIRAYFIINFIFLIRKIQNKCLSFYFRNTENHV